MPPVVVGPRCNRRVTCDLSPSNARSESAIAVNPLDPYNMVGASKRFTDPSIYAFSLAAYATFDGGLSWVEAPPLTLLPGWAGTSDPAVAWDDQGTAYLVALPFGPGTSTDYTGAIIGVAVYKSGDGGRTWGPPTLIHSSGGDDKQWAAGDLNPASPHHGNVYAAWDNGSQLGFARTTDHGTTWKGIKLSGVDQPAGTSLSGINDSFSPELSVALDGTIYIVWIAGTQIKFVKSTDGGDSFSAPMIVATGITLIPFQLPGGKFRTYSLPTGCTGAGNNVVFAWADYREGVSRIYYRHSPNGGSSWHGAVSGEPMLTGPVASAANQHDFHPQLISTPAGEIGCAFYEFGPKGGDPEFAPSLIDVILALSTDNGKTFANRVTATEQPWDPAVDAPLAHGNPNVTFIGEYFGLDASRLGFFPFFTDTRTGVQEIYASRIAVDPADIYIRDSSSDTGSVPSPGFHWEAPDLIVRRQPDGDSSFSNEDLLRDGMTEHHVYGRVTNNGPSTARNVRLAVTVANYPSLMGLPGTEFRYPQDWYPGDWNTPSSRDNHLFLGESAPVNVPSGATRILGPVSWPAAQVPPPASWHPCLLAEVRADNNDSAGGANGCDIDADPDPCVHGSYFWGNNNVCQRNLSYAPVLAGAAAALQLPFLVGSVWSAARFLEVIVDKGPELAFTPMTLRMESVTRPSVTPEPSCLPAELVFEEKSRVLLRTHDCHLGEIVAPPGTVWRPVCPPQEAKVLETCHGGERAGDEWELTQPKAAVGFPVAEGERRRMTLSFTTPATLKPGTRALVRIYQRNDRRIITGSVHLQVVIGESSTSTQVVERLGPREAVKRPARRRGNRPR